MNLTEKQRKRRFWIIASILGLSLVIAFFLSLYVGVSSITPLEVLQTLLGYGTDKQALILFEFRMPRIILALLIGMGLAVAGSIMQSITQNDLADPGIMGINAGAGFAIVLFLFFFKGLDFDASLLSTFTLPIAAFLGALSAAVLIYLLAWRKGVTSIRLILVGIGVNALFSAALTIIQLKMDPQNYRQVVIWLTGDIWKANWHFVWILLVWMIILLPIVLKKTKILNVFHLGDDMAAGLGARVELERGLLLLIAVALAGASVAAGGAIAFLGLVTPHIVRRMIGPQNQYVIPLAALMGALILVLSDIVAKGFFEKMSLPVGIVVAIVSTPYFIYLLMKTK